jgi:probable phosphoglycerate mutase
LTSALDTTPDIVSPRDSKGQLILIRHGQSTWNGAHLVQGHNDTAVLTELGRRQALESVSTLRGLGFQKIISSDLARARETAQIIAQELGLGIETTRELRERSYGTLEGQPFEQLTPERSGIENDLVVDATAHPPGGESLDNLYARTGTFIEETRRLRPGQSLLIVTHGGTIRSIRAYCQGQPMLGLTWDPVTNCSIWPI